MWLDASVVLAMLAESAGTAGVVIPLVIILTLLAALHFNEYVWNSCAWRLRRAGRPERPRHHSWGMNTHEEPVGSDVYRCLRCGYVRHDHRSTAD